MQTSYPYYVQIFFLAPYSSIHIISNIISRFAGKFKIKEAAFEEGNVSVSFLAKFSLTEAPPCSV
jgi:hypothetical protein